VLALDVKRGGGRGEGDGEKVERWRIYG